MEKWMNTSEIQSNMWCDQHFDIKTPLIILGTLAQFYEEFSRYSKLFQTS